MQKSPFKYWMLTTEYPPQFGGGIATYSWNTAKMMSENGHDVTVFIYDESVNEDIVLTENNIRVIRFPINKTGTETFLGFHAQLSYEYAHTVREYLANETPPDIIESQEYHGIAYYLQQFKLLVYPDCKDLKIVITCHAPSFICLEFNQSPLYELPNYWTGQMEKSSIHAADILISPSQYFVSEAKKRMQWHYIDEHVVPNPISSNSIDESDLSFEKNHIVCFGKLSALKGSFKLLEYFKEAWDKGESYSLYLIGGYNQIFHPENDTMKNLITNTYKKYIDQNLLILEGALPPSIALQKIQESHVIVIPSLFDNLPYSVLEAMSYGKVVLASSQGGQSEIIIDGENGFLFDYNIKDDFLKKLNLILQLSPDQIKQIGANASRHVKTTYSPEKIYSQKIAILSGLLAKNQNRNHFPIHFTSDQKKKQPTCNDKLLSVVIPFYNMGAYIEECVLSVLASDYSALEIIIVNDGSTEQESIDALKNIEANYDVSVYNKTNEGLALTRNFGATQAKGSYLAFLDADDTVCPDYFSKAIRVLNQYSNIHFVGCWTKYHGLSTNSWPCFNPEPPYLLLHNMINSSSLVYHKNSFAKAGHNRPEMKYGMEDWDSVISMVKNGYHGVVLPEQLFNYRIRKGSMARMFTRNKQLDLQRLMAARHSEFYSLYGSEIFLLLNSNGSSLYFDNPTFEKPIHDSSALRLVLKLISQKLKRKIKQNEHIRSLAYKIYKRTHK